MIARTIRKVATGGSAPIAQTGIRSMKPTQNGSWTRKVGASASAAPACDIEAAAFAKSCIDYPFGGYKRLLEEQRGLCAICRGPSGRRALSVDHDHTTGAMRGLPQKPPWPLLQVERRMRRV